MTGAAAGFSTLGGRVGQYLRSHWRGEQSFAWSFWVNLVLVRALILAAEDIVYATVSAGVLERAALACLIFVVAHVIVFAWQTVGLLRACDVHQRAFQSMLMVYAVYVGIFLSFVFTSVNGLGAVHYVFGEFSDPASKFGADLDRADLYSMRVSDDGRTLYLSGIFEPGITRDLRAFIGGRAALKRVLLVSRGGNVFEGRGVAKLIKEKGLDTHAVADCFSACTIAFIAGVRRTLGPDGVLGFHQYRIDADYQVPMLDIAKVQAGDLAIFRSQNVSEAFLRKVFNATNTDLWKPGIAELIEARVVHAVTAAPRPN